MFKSSQSILQIISAMVLLLVAVPLAYVAINLISSPNKFIEYLVETKTLRLAWNTILLAVTVAVASI